MLCLALIVLLAAGAQVGVAQPTGSAQGERSQNPDARLIGMGKGYQQQMMYQQPMLYQQPMMYQQQPYMQQQYPMMQQPYYMQGGYGMGNMGMPC